MRVAVLVATLMGIVCTSHGAIRTVAQDGNGEFTAIQTAIDASSAGDTIVVMGSVNEYAENLTVNRPLYIVGEGYGCSQTLFSAIAGTVTFAVGSDGSVIEGLRIRGGPEYVIVIEDNIGGVELLRCYIKSSNSGQAALKVGRDAICTVRESIMYVYNYSNNYGTCALVSNGASSSFYNTVFSPPYGSYSGVVGGDLTTTITVDNCAFVGLGLPLSGGSVWSVHNNVFWNCDWNGELSGQVFAGYNAIESSMTQFPQVLAQDVILTENPFVNYSENDNYQLCVSDLHLPTGSALIDAGDPAAGLDRDGTRRDIGVYGGSWLFSASGTPRFPFVTHLILPASVPQNGVLEIRSTGRVGQGGGQ